MPHSPTPPGFLDLRTDVPWWTEADQAELEARTWDLVSDLFDHREAGCEVCRKRRETAIGCSFVQERIEAVTEWRDRRERSNMLRWKRLVLATAGRPRPNPIGTDRLVEILRTTAP